MRYSGLLILSVLIISCGENTFQKQGDVFYKKGQSNCTEIKNHWLLDIKAQNPDDSIYLDTRQLGRKIEIHRLNTDTTSAFIQLLSSTCKGDSIQSFKGCHTLNNCLYSFKTIVINIHILDCFSNTIILHLLSMMRLR